VTVGAGRAGPVTQRLQRRFMEIVHGEVPDTRGWLSHTRPLATTATHAVPSPTPPAPVTPSVTPSVTP